MKSKYLDKLLKQIKEKPEDFKPSLKGISGAVFIFAVFLVLKILFQIINIVVHAGYLSSPDSFVYAILMLLVFLIPDTGISIAVLVYLMKKDIVFRKLFVIDTILLSVSTTGAFLFSLLVLGDFYETAIIHIAVAVLWVVYLYKSKRVKNTFIYPHTEFAKEERRRILEM